jgi:hypothetical protein
MDLHSVPSLTPSDAYLLQIAAKQLSLSVSRSVLDPQSFPPSASDAPSSGFEVAIQPQHIQHVHALLDEMQLRLHEIYASPNLCTNTQTIQSTIESNSLASSRWMPYPLFDRLKRDESVEHLAGGSKVPPIYRPVQLTLVADRVTTFEEAATALRHADHVCQLLAYQQATIKNTYALRVALIQHLFTAVLPIPLPVDHPKKAQCCWMQPMRYETQLDILRSIMLLGRHFAASALSIKVTRSFDATRILTMACMAAIADAVVRVKACDVPSLFSYHMRGEGPSGGPLSPFAFEMGEVRK